MWAVSPIPFWPSRPPTTTTTTTTTRQPCIYRPVSVYPKPRWQSRPRNRNYDGDRDEDGSAQAVPTSVKSSASLSPKQLNRDESDSDAASWELPQANESSAQDVGGLGRAVVTALRTPNSVNPTKSNAEGKQLSGSDVLWALREATAQKSKLKNREIPAVSKIKGGNEEDCRDYSNVCIRADWSNRLDDLERRLRELKDT